MLPMDGFLKRFIKTALCFFALFPFCVLTANAATADCTERAFDTEGWCHPQCVEYVKCVLDLKYYGKTAATWWSTPPEGYEKITNGSKILPEKNDVMVWTDTAEGYGHVAIVEELDKSTRIVTVSDTNFSHDFRNDCNFRRHDLEYKMDNNGFITIDGVAGWLKKISYFAIGRVTEKIEMYSKIAETDVQRGNTVFPKGSPSGDSVSLNIGDEIKLEQVISNDTINQYTYRIQTSDGRKGYVYKSGVSIQSILGDKGAILDIHLSLPYEFEGDVELMDRYIDKYLKFISFYPQSKYISEALLFIINFDCQALHPDLEDSRKEMRIRRIYNNLKTLKLQSGNGICQEKKNRLLKFIERNSSHISQGGKYHDFVQILWPAQRVFWGCIPTTITR